MIIKVSGLRPKQLRDSKETKDKVSKDEDKGREKIS